MKKLNELFTVTYGVNLELYKLTLSDGLDSINYVSRTKKNNGVSARVERIANLAPNPANTLSIALTGSVLEVFLQEEEYYSGRDIAYLTPIESMDRYTLLMYCTLIRHNQFKYCQGRGANTTVGDILLPELSELSQYKKYDALPDISTIPDYFLEEGYERACWYMDNVDQHDFEKKYRPSFFSEAIDTYRQKRSRKPCSLNEIFTIEYPKTLVYAEMQPASDGINFVSSKGKNNGVVGRVEKKDGIKVYSKGCITVPLKGSVLSTSIQQEDCYVAHQTAVLTPILEMSIYTKMYIITLINANKFRFNYGRQADNTLKNLQIELPVDAQGEYDWDYMENYIKSLPYSANI